MPKKKPTRRTKPRSKGWISFWMVVIIIAVVGSLTLFTFHSSSEESHVQGISTASGSSILKPSVSPVQLPKPKVYLTQETLSRGKCFPEFQKVEYTCSDGFSGTYDTTTCVSIQQLQKNAEYACLLRGVTGTPRPFPGEGNQQGVFPPKPNTSSTSATTNRR